MSNTEKIPSLPHTHTHKKAIMPLSYVDNPFRKFRISTDRHAVQKYGTQTTKWLGSQVDAGLSFPRQDVHMIVGKLSWEVLISLCRQMRGCTTLWRSFLTLKPPYCGYTDWTGTPSTLLKPWIPHILM